MLLNQLLGFKIENLDFLSGLSACDDCCDDDGAVADDVDGDEKCSEDPESTVILLSRVLRLLTDRDGGGFAGDACSEGDPRGWWRAEDPAAEEDEEVRRWREETSMECERVRVWMGFADGATEEGSSLVSERPRELWWIFWRDSKILERAAETPMVEVADSEVETEESSQIGVMVFLV